MYLILTAGAGSCVPTNYYSSWSDMRPSRLRRWSARVIIIRLMFEFWYRVNAIWQHIYLYTCKLTNYHSGWYAPNPPSGAKRASYKYSVNVRVLDPGKRHLVALIYWRANTLSQHLICANCACGSVRIPPRAGCAHIVKFAYGYSWRNIWAT